MLEITKDIKKANLITHSGKFHADDVFATAFLTKIIDNPVVCRVNNIDFEVENDVLVYDIGFGKFDHHQKEFCDKHDSGVKYASFGLLFREFGLNYLESINAEYASCVFSMIEHDLVEGIDAVDNGEFPEICARYNYKSIDAIIGDFNVCWNEEIDNDIYFIKAVEVADSILMACIKKCFAKAEAKKYVDVAIENSCSHIMTLDRHMPFKDFVITSSNPKAKDILFCITPSNRGGYNVHTIPKDKNTHETRCDFPSSWGGLTNDALREVSGIKSAIFCHTGLFLSTCETKEDAYRMAELAINNSNNGQ